MYLLFSYQSVRTLFHLVETHTLIVYAWSRHNTELVAKLPQDGRIGTWNANLALGLLLAFSYRGWPAS